MTSRVVKSIIELEGMAMAGLLREARLEECPKPEGWKKLVVVDSEGVEYETKCVEDQAARRSFLVFSAYISRWSDYIVKP
ncbi:MAG: hypothetical protein P3X22_001125 [Thermoprotei archaeon]|nr:hypothetical protein [Thermoprotei archaeon]